MHRQKIGARAEYRQQEGQRIKDSLRLADKFPLLKSLTVDLTFYDAAGVSKCSQIKYRVNLDNAKSVFRFDCVNQDCIRGDFSRWFGNGFAVGRHEPCCNRGLRFAAALEQPTFNQQ